MSLRHLCLLQNETARQQKKKYYVQIEKKTKTEETPHAKVAE